ncbi:MAG: tRNA uridine-5-carboxymethylaminomethyl(34) synthesis GTPase MnmE [Rhodothermales bacterium]|nr:tRNA uridine-5-carboxymethylaminomethyl(34) synthesis GTPase MnmE [Rhodothermales bacterium]
MGGGTTIAAIATARGEAALAIVRVSGPEALRIASEVFKGFDLTSAPERSVWFGRAVGSAGQVLDEVVATVFRGPRSSTGEDVVELTCHGGDAAPSAVLRALFDAGAEPAEPGEFTRRSFINGKLDLEQAEGIMDLIHARSAAAHSVSVRQLRGRLKNRLATLRENLLRTCGLVELELDFGEEDLEFADRTELTSLLSDAEGTVQELLASAQLADKWRDGLTVVIAGRPNAGKSTLLNALVGHDRVIVSSTPGTTRDFVECEFELDGLLLKLVDTAGLRVTEDEIEADGVRRTEALIASADVLIYVYDSLEGLSETEIQALNRKMGRESTKKGVIVANKADLLTAGFTADFGQKRGLAREVVRDDGYKAVIASLVPVSLSAARAQENPEELEALLAGIREAIPSELRDYSQSDGMINERHRRHLLNASQAISAAQHHVASGSGGELISLELRSALNAIGSITGEITNEDVLSEIFGRFCIGK